jgi:ADP-L-glycero-D-manno-heptose 6-epimerase
VIVVTGAAGFIGSNIVADLQESRGEEIAAVDWFGAGEAWRNLAKRRIAAFVFPEDVVAFLDANAARITAVIHMGAISATVERDVDRLVRHNIQASVALWDWCAAHAVPFIYASSAATYGGRESGFVDGENPEVLAALAPLNPYGWSKKAVDDIFAGRAAGGEPTPPQWVGLKFFNVYGPNEYHKGEMRSVAAKLFDEMQAGRPARLFASHRPGIADGEQRRDFVYVKDCTKTISWLLDHPRVGGIYNLGSGRARSFLDVAHALGLALGRAPAVEFCAMPEELRERYQYFTEADLTHLRARGCDIAFTSLEDGIADYVENYLSRPDRYR